MRVRYITTTCTGQSPITTAIIPTKKIKAAKGPKIAPAQSKKTYLLYTHISLQYVLKFKPAIPF